MKTLIKFAMVLVCMTTLTSCVVDPYIGSAGVYYEPSYTQPSYRYYYNYNNGYYYGPRYYGCPDAYRYRRW